MPYISSRERTGYPYLLHSQIDFYDKTNYSITGHFDALQKMYANAQAIIGSKRDDPEIAARLKDLLDQIQTLFTEYDPAFEDPGTITPSEKDYRFKLFTLNCGLQALIADTKIIDHERPDSVPVA